MGCSKELSAELESILTCCRFCLEQQHRKQLHKLLLGPVDWHLLIREANYHQISPLVYYHLNQIIQETELDCSIPAELKRRYHCTAVANVKYWEEFQQINKPCAKAGIEIIGLRGITFFHTLYPQKALRSMRDIDILAKTEDIFQLRRIFLERGYQEVSDSLSWGYKLKYGCGTNFIKYSYGMRIILNLHWSLAAARPFIIYLPQLWSRAERRKIDRIEITILSKEDNFLSLALHLRRHCNALALKYFLDTAEFMRLHGKAIDWQYVQKYSRANHINNTVYFALYICKTVLGYCAAEQIQQRFTPDLLRRKLIALLINKRNYFRRVTAQRILLRLLLFDRVIDIVIYLVRVSFVERFLNGRLLPILFRIKYFTHLPKCQAPKKRGNNFGRN